MNWSEIGNEKGNGKLTYFKEEEAWQKNFFVDRMDGSISVWIDEMGANGT